MGLTYSTSKREPNGLYKVTVNDGNSTYEMDGLYIRFDTPGATLGAAPEDELDQNAPPAKQIRNLAKLMRSQTALTIAFGALLDKKDDVKVAAVYVPVDKITKPEDAKLMMAYLHVMYMSEGEVIQRMTKAMAGNPSKKRSDQEQMKMIIDAFYSPMFRLKFDAPPGASYQKKMNDSRDIILTKAYNPMKIPNKPTFPPKINWIVVILVIVIVLFMYKKFVADKKK